MQPDQQTLVMGTVFIALVLSLLGAVTRLPRRTNPGFGRWAMANLLLVLSFPLLALRETAPDWLSVVGANTFVTIAAILYLEGARQFRGLRPRVWSTYAAGGLAVLSIVYYDYLRPSVNARVIVISSLTGILGLLCCLTLLKETPDERKPGTGITAAAFAVSAVILIGHAIYFALAPASGSLFVPSWINAAFSLAATLAVLWWSASFIVMTDEGLMMDLKEAESRAVKGNVEVAECRPAEALPRESEAR
jgi:hypothetical protein